MARTCAEDPLVIEKILTHLERKDAYGAAANARASLPPSRASPQVGSFA